MNNLRKYIRNLITKELSEDAVEEITSSSEKKDDVESDQSTWKAEFSTGGKPNASVMNAQTTTKTLWDLKFKNGTATTNKTASPAK